MTVHSTTDTHAIIIPGGCGAQHDRADGDARLSVTCAQCEPRIIDMGTGWSHDPAQAALCPDEIAEMEAKDAAARRAQNTTWTDPGLFVAQMADAMRAASAGPAQPAAQPLSSASLVAALMGMSVEERAVVAAMLTAVPAPGPELAAVEREPVKAAVAKRAPRKAPMASA